MGRRCTRAQSRCAIPPHGERVRGFAGTPASAQMRRHLGSISARAIATMAWAVLADSSTRLTVGCEPQIGDTDEAHPHHLPGHGRSAPRLWTVAKADDAPAGETPKKEKKAKKSKKAVTARRRTRRRPSNAFSGRAAEPQLRAGFGSSGRCSTADPITFVPSLIEIEWSRDRRQGRCDGFSRFRLRGAAEPAGERTRGVGAPQQLSFLDKVVLDLPASDDERVPRSHISCVRPRLGSLLSWLCSRFCS